VVDGGSTDQTVPLACAQNVLVLEAPQGRGLQMHVGALASTGDVFWFLHADTIPPPQALEHIRKSLETRSSVDGNFGLLFDGPSRAARQLTAIYPLLRIFGLCYGIGRCCNCCTGAEFHRVGSPAGTLKFVARAR
jgi:hypothetical protein